MLHPDTDERWSAEECLDSAFLRGTEGSRDVAELINLVDGW